MATTRTQELIDAVNAVVDPVALINFIGFLPEKKVLSGSTLRAPCPIHRDDEYLTLFVNTRKKSYRCSVEACAGNGGGDLVSLYALIHELSPPAAARELVVKLGLPVDLAQFRRYAADCFEEAEEHYIKRELEHAIEIAGQALAMDGGCVEAMILLYKIHRERADAEAAADYILRAARHHRDTGDFKEAEKLLRRAIQQECCPERMWEAMSHLAMEQGDMAGARHALERQLALAIARGDATEELNILNQLADLEPEAPSRLESLAEAYVRHGNDEEACNTYLRLAEGQRRKRHPLKVLAHLDQALKINPEYVAALEWKSQVYLEEGDKPAAAGVLRRLSELAEQRDDLAAAKSFLDEYVDLIPQGAEGYRLVAEYWVRRKDLPRAIESLMRAAQVEQKAGNFAIATRLLDRALEVDPANVTALERVAEMALQQGRHDEACDRYLSLAERHLKAGARDEALRVLKQIIIINQKELKLRARVVDRLQEAGFDKAASHERQELIRAAFLARDYELCLEQVARGLEFDATDVELLGYRKEALSKLNRAVEAAHAAVALAEALIGKGRQDRAEVALREALQTSNNVQTYMNLQRLLLTNGKADEAMTSFMRNVSWLSREENLPHTAELARDLLFADPDAHAVRMVYANVLEESGELAAALEQYYLLAATYRRLRDLGQAELVLRLIGRLAPEDFKSGAALVLILAEKGEMGEARKEIDTLLTIDPSRWDDDTADSLSKAAVKVAPKDEEFLARFVDLARRAGSKASGRAAARVSLRLARLAENRDVARAIELVDFARSESPNDLGIALYLQRLLVQAGRQEQARPIFDTALALAARLSDPAEKSNVIAQALSLFPDDPEVLRAAAESLDTARHEREVLGALDRLVAAAVKAGDAGAERRWIDRRTQVAGGSVNMKDLERLVELAAAGGDRAAHQEAGLRVVQTLRDRENLEAAMSQARKLKKLFPQEPKVREAIVEMLRAGDDAAALGEELLGLGDLAVSNRSWSRAELHFREAQQLEPQNPEILERLAQMIEERGDAELASREYLALGAMLKARGDVARALTVVQHLATLAPYATDHLSLLADLQEANKRPVEAAQSLMALLEGTGREMEAARLSALCDRAAKLDPKNATLRHRVAELHAVANLMEAAARHYAAAARLLHEEGDLPGAEASCREALTLNPELRPARELLVRMQKSSGDREGAVKSLRALAASHSSEGSLAEAVQTYRDLLAVDPTDGQAMVDLAECLQLTGQQDEAREVLHQLCLTLDPTTNADLLILHARRLLDLNPTDVALRERLARAYRVQGKAIPELDQRTHIFMQEIEAGHKKKAEAQLQVLREIDPGAFETHLCEARWLKQTDAAGAEKLFAAMIDELIAGAEPERASKLCFALANSEPRNFELRRRAVAAYLKLGGVADGPYGALKTLLADAEKAGRPEAVRAALDAAVEACPDSIPLLRDRAAHNEKSGELQAALGDMQSAARLLSVHKKHAEALALLKRAVELAPEEAEGHRRMAEAAELAGNKEVAIAAHTRYVGMLEKTGAPADTLIPPLMKLSDLVPADESIQTRLITLLRESGKPMKAAELYFDRARTAEEQRRVPDALREMRHALKLAPQHTVGRKAYAELLAKTGAVDDARVEYLTLASQFDQKGKVGLAIQSVTAARDLDPHHPEPYIRLGDVYSRQNNKERALQAYSTAAARLVDRKQFAAAIEVLERCIDLNPEDAHLHRQLFSMFFSIERETDATPQGMKLARFFLRSGDLRQANAVIDRLRSFRAQPAAFHLSLAELYREFEKYDHALEVYLETAATVAAEGQLDDALAALAMADSLRLKPIEVAKARLTVLELKKVPREELVREWRALADAMAVSGGEGEHADEEIALRRRIVEEAPEEAAQRERLAELYERQDDRRAAAVHLVALGGLGGSPESDDAIRWFRRALDLDPHNAEAAQALASAYSARGEMEHAVEAYLKLAAAQGARTETAQQESTLLRVLKIEPSNIEALRMMMEITRRRQDPARFWNFGLKLATLYEEMERPAEARGIYEEAVMMDGGNLTAWQRLAELNEVAGNVDATVRILKNIARTHEERGDAEEALAAFERVISLAPTELDTALEAADLAAAHGMARVATSILERSLTASSHSEEIDPGVMVELCRKMLSLSPERHETRRLLAHLLEDRGEVDASAEEWQTLATGYSAAERPEDALYCLKRVRALDPGGDREITRKIARLEAAAGKEDESRRLFSSMVARARSDGDTKRALELATEMSAALPFEPEGEQWAVELCNELDDVSGEVRHLCELARRLAGHGDFPEAETRLAEAARLAPHSTLPTRTRAHLLIQGGDVEGARVVLTELADRSRKSTTPEDYFEILRELKAIAPENLHARLELLEQMEKRGDAEGVHRERGELIEVLFMLGDVEGAAEVADHLVEGDQSSFDDVARLARRFQVQAASDVALRLYLAMARRMLRERRFREADLAARAASEIAPDSIEVLDLDYQVQSAAGHELLALEVGQKLATASIEAGQLDDAEQLLHRLTTEQPESAAPHELLARLYKRRQNPRRQALELRLAADLFARQGNGVRAFELLGELLVLAPSDEEALRRRVELGTSQELGPACLAAFYQLAEFYLSGNRFTDFELLAQEAEALFPGDPQLAEYRDMATSQSRTRRSRPRTAEKSPPVEAPAPPTEEKAPLAPIEAAEALLDSWGSSGEIPAAPIDDDGDMNLPPESERFAVLDVPDGADAPDDMDEMDGMDEMDDTSAPASTPAAEEPAVVPVGNDERTDQMSPAALAPSAPPEADLPAWIGESAPHDHVAAPPPPAMRADAGRQLERRLALWDLAEEPCSVDPAAMRAAIAGGLAAESVKTLQAAAAEHPGEAPLHVLLAEAHEALGNTPMAIQELHAAAQLVEDPEDPRHLDIARRVHALEPTSPQWLSRYVDLLWSFECYGEAEDKALELARIYVQRSHRELAEGVLRRILGHAPNDVPTLRELVDLRRGKVPSHELGLDLVLLAGALAQENDRVEAAETLEEALRLSPEDPSIVSAVVRVRRQMGQRDQLAADLTQLARLYIDEGKASLALGCLDEADGLVGKSPQRDRLRQRAGLVVAASPSPIGFGGELSDTRTDRTEAIENFKAVLRLDPDNVEIHHQMARLYRQMGDPAGERTHSVEVVRVLESRSMWRELIEVLPKLAARFPQEQAFPDALARVRSHVRQQNVVGRDVTQTGARETGE